ncbi:ABC transporter ATP-binding protein [Oceanobacillus rekensis]|uniref:ABC transporter ATP-binding protein n=1 Tax=Oceanobacillus rekensis TaxID=937927 RepID=UPI000B454642|nr:ATP-binding cassette domain-containing protein [Oceanobacillus rekensis]
MKLKVEFKNVYKKFPMHAKQNDKLLNLFSINRKKQRMEFAAVKDVSFKVYEGETIGIVGLNGSGKSTVSNMLAQVIQPTDGEIIINGETSLIAISAGLNNNLSGIENIKLKCMMHGLKNEDIERLTPDIIDFADIGEHINQPVKNYSSGMRSRLGFAIAIHTDPDILIIDEALSVGDSTFTDKCLNKLNEFKKQGKTIFFISHSASQMRTFCDRVIWMHYGENIEFGPKEEVINNYVKHTKWINGLTNREKRRYKNKKLEEQNIVNSEIGKRQKTKYKVLPIISRISLFIPLILFGALVLMGY